MRKDNNILVGYAAVLVYSCLSGVSFVWTKRLLEHGFPVFTIVLIRLIIGAIFLLLTLRLFNKLEPLKRKDIKDFILLAIGEPFIYFIGEDFGLKYVDATCVDVLKTQNVIKDKIYKTTDINTINEILIDFKENLYGE